MVTTSSWRGSSPSRRRRRRPANRGGTWSGGSACRPRRGADRSMPAHPTRRGRPPVRRRTARPSAGAPHRDCGAGQRPRPRGAPARRRCRRQREQPAAGRRQLGEGLGELCQGSVVRVVGSEWKASRGRFFGCQQYPVRTTIGGRPIPFSPPASDRGVHRVTEGVLRECAARSAQRLRRPARGRQNRGSGSPLGTMATCESPGCCASCSPADGGRGSARYRGGAKPSLPVAGTTGSSTRPVERGGQRAGRRAGCSNSTSRTCSTSICGRRPWDLDPPARVPGLPPYQGFRDDFDGGNETHW